MNNDIVSCRTKQDIKKRKKTYLIIAYKISIGVSILDQIAKRDPNYSLRSKYMLSYEDRIYTVVDIRSKDFYRGRSFTNLIVDFYGFKVHDYSEESILLNVINKFMVNKRSIIDVKDHLASLQ